MRTIDQQTRQMLGCGLAPLPPANLSPFVSMFTGCGSQSEPATDEKPAFPSVCPGYTTRLPEVIEIARARLHWSKGALRIDDWSTSPLAFGIEFLESASNECQQWQLDNPEKK
jgi:hypothetical protein